MRTLGSASKRVLGGSKDLCLCESEGRWTPDFTLLYSQRSCDKRGRFAPDTRSTAAKHARKARSRKLDPSGFQVSAREHSFTRLRVTEQSVASARPGLLPIYLFQLLSFFSFCLALF
jgi:hypothetical protein